MIGITVSHYKIIEKLSEGGMGVVYKAQDLKLDRFVALKFLPPHLTTSEEEKQRFIHEAKAASSLQHNNICAIHAIDETGDGQLFICMDYYEGGTLDKRIKDKPLPLEEAIDIAIQIAQGLAKAHEKEIVHRDIKPANIMLTKEGVVKILDFGLAKLSTQTKLTREGTILGTIAYMSPEQAMGKKIDHRTDIWALGVILYEMLAGENPFKSEYEQAMMYAIVNEDPEFISKIRADIPLEVEKIIERTLNKNPEKRFQSMQEMWKALEHPITDIHSGKSKTASAFRLGRQQRKFVLRFAPVVIVLLTIFAYFVLFKDVFASPVSIVLLPLENISRDAEQEWFTEGMTDALITDLARISSLRIISRFSAMKHKGANKSSSEIAAELGVSHIIEGSVVKTEELVKISVRLIDAASDEYIWAQGYERDLKDILSLQGDVARAIARQIEVNLTPNEKTYLTEKSTVNPEAHESYLKGNFYWFKLTRQALETSLQYFELAAELDPDYALAYAGIALVWGGRAQMGYAPMRTAGEKAKAATAKALELDNSLAEVHFVNAAFHGWWGDWNWGLAASSFENAIRLNPNMAEARAYYSHILFFLNRPETGMEQIEHALKLDPFNTLFKGLYAMCLNYDHHYDEAISVLQLALEKSHAEPILLSTLRTTYHQKKMYQEALEIWRRSFEARGDQQSMAALEWFEKALVAHDPNMPYLNVDPIFDYMRDNPRFKVLVSKVGL